MRIFVVTKMGKKSRAEIQKAYRERKKLQRNAEAYKERERERKRNAYVPVSELDPSELKRRRSEVNDRLRRHREKNRIENLNKGGEDMARTRSSKKRAVPTESPRLLVKFNFSKQSRSKQLKGGKKRASRALSKARRKIQNLEEMTKQQQAKVWKLQKRLQRAGKTSSEKSSSQPSSSSSSNSEPFEKSAATTPRSRMRADLSEAGITPETVSLTIRKKLTFVNALMDGVKETSSSDKKTKVIVAGVLSEKILKRYRLMSMIKKNTGLSKRSLYVGNRSMKQRLPLLRKQLEETVIKFLERDDNSRMMPGKADYKKHEGKKVQKRYLNDYLGNLHEKFKAENPETKMSRSLFCRFRPGYILTSSFTSRSTCLCQRHQNMALKLRSLKAIGIELASSPDLFIEKLTDDTNLDTLLQSCGQVVKYKEWKRVQEEDGKKRMKLLDMEDPKDKFCKEFKNQVKEFKGHTERVRKQYEQVKLLKNTLPKDHVIVQMDFAENYSCQTMEEIQSAYWNSAMVTLHPAVAYYKDDDGVLTHKSTVFVSDEMGHNASTVYAIIQQLVPYLKEIKPTIQYLHYVTDSPTSQYRNKTIFHVVSQHAREFGFPASWHYFEAGHGKGPCDGVGGTVKRMADEATRQQKVTIQDANDFYAWAEQQQSGSTIKYKFVSKDECAEAHKKLDDFGQLTPVPETMKLHAVVGLSAGNVMVRNTSCFCQQCFSSGKFNADSDCSWRRHQLKLVVSEENLGIKPKVDDWVAAMYESKWYIGKVLEVDEKDNDVQVSFMVDAATRPISFKWPSTRDVIWVEVSKLLCIIEKPQPRGKSKRQFVLSEQTLEMIDSIFAEKKE